jgi:RNA polymerase sigma factor (sigma-70 family)
MTEEQLIDGCRKENLRAQKELYQQFAPLMMGLCMRYTSSREDAEDVLQDGFIKVFGKIDTYSGQGAFGGWIRRIILNTALQKYRDNRSLQLHVPMDEVDYQLDNSESIMATLSAKELMQKIQKLPDGCRAIFNLYAIEGYKHDEIAKELGISSGTSKSQYSRARHLLRQMIEQEQVSERAI